jgi:flagellar hook-associated protein 2
MPIDGLVSGLDTESIITKLMDLERVPRTEMSDRRDAATSALDALKTIDAKLGSLTLAARSLAGDTAWLSRTATSSDPSVATASASLGAAPAQLSFTVDALARAHALVTATSVASGSVVIASSGTVVVDVGGSSHTLAVGGGSLDEVAAAVNAAGIGIRATVVDTGSGVRLQFSATTTGASSEFAVQGLDGPSGGTAVTTQGSDARITIGSGPGAYSVTSSTNAFDGLTPGVSVVVKAVSAAPVDITVGSDPEAIADRVAALVDAANGALTEIAQQTAYDASTNKASVLTGDAGVRRVAQSLVRAVTDAVTRSSLVSSAFAGVSIDRSGQVTFDRDTFLAAYAKDPVAVQRLFDQGGTASSTDLHFVSAGDTTAAGSATVEVTALATAATIRGGATTWPPPTPITLSVRRGSVVASYEVQTSDSQESAIAALQAQLDAAGIDVAVSADGDGLSLTARRAGSANSFEVAWDGATFVPAAGTDIAGTIDGVPVTGIGNDMVVPSGSRAGLRVTYDGTTTGVVGTISYEPGLAQRLVSAVALARDPNGGALTSSAATRQSRIDLLTRSIDAYDRRLTAREAQLRKQYSDLEVALGQLQSTGNWLAGQLNGLSAGNNS